MRVEILLGVVQLEADEEALTLFRPAPERRCHVAGKDIARPEPRKIAVVAQGLCRQRSRLTARVRRRRGLRIPSPLRGERLGAGARSRLRLEREQELPLCLPHLVEEPVDLLERTDGSRKRIDDQRVLGLLLVARPHSMASMIHDAYSCLVALGTSASPLSIAWMRSSFSRRQRGQLLA